MDDIEITTARLELHRLSLEDAPALLSYRSDDAVSRYQGFHPRALDDAKKFIQDYTKCIDVDGAWFQLGVFLPSGELIGDIGIHFLDKEAGVCEIGYTIRPDCQRRGFGKEAALGVLSYLFDSMGKRKVIASVDSRNEASMRMLESMGFALVGRRTDESVYEMVAENSVRR